jgi:hypothetical protein
MHYGRSAFRILVVIALAAIAAVLIGACGSASSSGNANTLLGQTFSGSHKVNSGVLNLNLTIDPAGSSTLSGPITLSFSGPFQSRGTGQLPASNFTISGSALGQTVSVGIISTGTAGYVTLQGANYQMPQATFQRLESSFSQLTSSQRGSGSGTLSELGIHPLHWLAHPSVVGTESVGGVPTTHIHAGVNVPGLLNDLNTFLRRASSLGATGTSALRSGLSPATRNKIAAEIRNASVDIWTGNSDKTLRRLIIALTLPVSGKTSQELGGMTSADLSLTMQYSDLNQPQTITAPTSLRPYSEFQAKVRAFLQEVEGVAGQSFGGTLGGRSGGAGGGTSLSGGGTGTNGASGTASGVTRYSQCIQAAGGDVAKMQRCASLLGSGG